MKRLNPKTNKPFVIGEAREDGYRFDGYITARIKLDGYYKENWRHPERYLLNRQYQRDRKKKLYTKISSYLNEIKSKSGCIKCGYNDSPYALEFHHRDRSHKVRGVSSFFRNSYKQLDKIINEVKKCDILCSNCHKILTKKEIDDAS